MSDNPLLTPRRRRTLELWPGDVEQKLDEFAQAIEKAYSAEESGATRANSKPEPEKIATERDAYLEKVRHESPKVTLEGLTERAVQELRDGHPPRSGDKGDEAAGYNRETFPSAMIRACLVEPQVTDAQWAEFMEEATTGRVQRLLEVASRLSMEDDVDLPKSSAVSTVMRRRELDQRLREITE